MEKIYQKYAELAVKKGVNVQPGQMVVITCPVEAYEFANLCAEEAYKANAGFVEIRYSNGTLTKLGYEYGDPKYLTRVFDWEVIRQKEAVEAGCCFLHISSEKPGLLKDVDAKLLQEVNLNHRRAMEPFRAYTMNSIGQWTIIGLSNDDWAKEVFPELDVKEANKKLNDAILTASRVTEDNDPIKEWDEHNKNLSKHVDLLNEYHFDALHFKNSKGTDLLVHLNPKHIWQGGADLSANGILFNANIPTEEVFTMPQRTKVNGIVYSTKPLNYQGKLIDEFNIRFKDGKVVEYHALVGEDVLKNLIDLDEGSSYLGEVALISHDSPISNMNILFKNTLFDENASCHLALGAAYPTNMENGAEMSKDELLKNDCNVSMNHVDFMFGSEDMHVDGIKGDQIVVLFDHGNFIV